VAGNAGQAARLYVNSGGSFGAGANIGDSNRSTTAVALGNVDADANAELAIATRGEGIRLYQFSGGSFGAPTVVEAGSFPTTSLVLADVNGDSRAELIAGNDGERNRFYRNEAGILEAGQELPGAGRRTMALVVGNVDSESGFELIAGNDRQPSRLYRWRSLLGTTANASGYAFGEDIDADNQLVDSAQLSAPVELSTDAAIAIVVEPSATIVLGPGSQLTASHDVILSAATVAENNITTLKSGFGLTYGNSSPVAKIDVENGALIKAANNVQVASQIVGAFRSRLRWGARYRRPTFTAGQRLKRPMFPCRPKTRIRSAIRRLRRVSAAGRAANRARG
jgi:hypothetical protein